MLESVDDTLAEKLDNAFDTLCRNPLFLWSNTESSVYASLRGDMVPVT